MRLKVSHFLALVVVTALTVGLLAGPASAKTTRLSAKQKVAIRAQLRKAIKKNPRVIRSKSFVKRASLVNFKLPITVRLRTNGNGCPLGIAGAPCFGQGTNTGALANLNTANIDLGASLGQRQLSLAGSLPGYIQFHDSFDGGALGNVDIVLTQGGDISTTSLPLLWNPQVSDPSTHWYDAGFSDLNPPPAGAGNPLNYTANPGCGDFKNSLAVTDSSPGLATNTAGKTLTIPGPTLANPTGSTVQGVPYFLNAAQAQAHAASGTVEEYPANDDITLIHTGANTGDINAIGPNPNPFPVPPNNAANVPTATYNAQDVVLRTAPIHLGVTAAGTNINESNPADGAGPQSSQNIVAGQSGGQANLFGNIPGKSHGIDVTVNLDGSINSILRSVDPDVNPLLIGAPYNASAFNCRQAFTGAVHNYIPGLKLQGDLHISPAITNDGKLRIAKATLSSIQPAHVALAACLMPYSTFSRGAAGNTPVAVPADALSGYGAADVNPVPTATPCNASPLGNVAASAFGGVNSLQNVPTTGSSGAQVSVAGDITTNISADVLIGG